MDILERKLGRVEDKTHDEYSRLIALLERRGDFAAAARERTKMRGVPKILSVNINWMERYANMPQINVVMSRLPQADEFVYEQKGPLYFAMAGPVARFFAYKGPDRGFGGSTFKILVGKGNEWKELKGPWSSNTASMNAAGFRHTKEVGLIERLGLSYAGAICVEVLGEALAEKNLPLYVGEWLDGDPMYTVGDPKRYTDNKWGIKPENLREFNNIQRVN